MNFAPIFARFILHMMKSLLLKSLLIFLSWVPSQAQQKTPEGYFLKRTTKVGEEIVYVLTYRHFPTSEVVFPDSTHDFKPFEYIRRSFFPTKTVGVESVDSVVYYLATFELLDTQHIAIPVYEITENGEKKAIYPPKDFVILERSIPTNTSDLKLISNTTPETLKEVFNYPYWIVGIGSVLLVGLIVFIFFGRSIRRSYRLRRLRKENAQFVLKFDTLMHSTLNSRLIEDALILWKNYTSKLTQLPLYSYTTKEIRQVIPNDKLTFSLKNIDKAIYAGWTNEENLLREHLSALKAYAQEVYEKKIEEVKHG